MGNDREELIFSQQTVLRIAGIKKFSEHQVSKCPSAGEVYFGMEASIKCLAYSF